MLREFTEERAEMVSQEITFSRQLSGYDRDQVDRYLQRLCDAYQTAYDGYNEMMHEYNTLLRRYRQLEEQEMSRPNQDIIAKILVDSESAAQKRISEANSEAEKIIAEARSTTADMRRELQTDREAFRRECDLEKAMIAMQSQKELEVARQEALVLGARAQQIIEDAQFEAFNIKEKAQLILTETSAQEERARIRAQAIIHDANVTITQSRALAAQSLAQIEEIIAQAGYKLQELQKSYAVAAVAELKKHTLQTVSEETSKVGN